MSSAHSFLSFCTADCTRDLVLLLAVGKSVFHSLAARFTVLGFLGVPSEGT